MSLHLRSAAVAARTIDDWKSHALYREYGLLHHGAPELHFSEEEFGCKDC